MNEQPIILCNSNPGASVESFVEALYGSARQSKAEIKLKFLEIETSVKSKFNQILSTLNHRRCRKEQVLEFGDGCIVEKEEEHDVSTQLVQIQKTQLIDLQHHLEKYCSVFPVSGSNSPKDDISFKKSYLLLLLVNERGIEPIVIKKANQVVSSK